MAVSTTAEFRMETILPEYIDLPRKLKERVAKAITDPVILPAEQSAGWLPEWMMPAIKSERVKNVLKGGQPEASSDLEIVAYLLCASCEGPLTEDAARLYFNLIGRTLPEFFVRTAKENGIPIGPVDETQERLIRDTKRRMSEDKKRKRRKAKWKAAVRILEGVSIELRAFDLFAKEGTV